MRFDFWNHPLVVSSFRVRFRGRTPGAVAIIYFLALLSLGAVLQQRLAVDPTVNWVRIYFVALVSIETIFAALFAASATFQSMHNEVVNRTLDYQRTAAIGPQEILLGKLLGEPAQVYLATLAGVPLMVWCWAMGAVTWIVFLLLLVNLVTTTMMFGAFGLVHPLDTTVDRTKMSGRSMRGMAVVILFFSIQMLSITPMLAQSPLGQAALGLLTPAISIYGVATSNAPLEYAFDLFGWRIPYLLITPIAQLAVVWLVIQSLSSRLISPVNLAMSKATVYAVLIVIDVVAASLLLSSPLVSVEQGVAAFCVAHLVAALLLMMNITPGRECLQSWLWRFRGRRPLMWDLLWGERSPNGGALVVFCMIGAIGALAMLALARNKALINNVPVGQLLPTLWPIIGVTCLVLLAAGSLFQFMYSIGRIGGVMFLGLMTILMVVPHLLGAYLQNDLLQGASPSAQFASWLFNIPPPPPLSPLILVYAALLIASQYLLARRISSGAAAVERKVSSMLATDTAPPT